jgi:hypothetical protein
MIRVKHLMTIAALLSSGSAHASSALWACTATTNFLCDSANCWKPRSEAWPRNAVIWTRIDVENGTYTRCTKTGCEEMPADIVTSGLYLVATPRHRSAIAKIYIGPPEVAQLQAASGMGEAQYLDVATLGTTPIINFGKCEFNPVQPE